MAGDAAEGRVVETGIRPTVHISVGGQGDPLGRDLLAGLLAWQLWPMLGWNDVRQRYRRSVLGPFWITLSMGILVGSMGIIYSRIFNTETRQYMPYLCLGLTIWGFISLTITESCMAFQESERIIRQIKLPFSVFIFRVVWRNFIVFMHTIVIFVPIALIFGIVPRLAAIAVLPGLLLLFLNAIWVSLILAILSTRFRDVQQIVGNALQVVFFATPIMWNVDVLGRRRIIADINPLFHAMELIREPLLGRWPAPESWLVAVGTIVAGWLLAMALFRRVSRRIAYWL